MSLIQLVIFGATGRMGFALEEECSSRPDQFAIVARWSSTSGGISQAGNSLKGKVVVIDFSSPTGLAQCLQWSSDQGFPVVSGTTGLGESQELAMAKAAQRIPILWSANMSPGMAWMQSVMSKFSQLRDFDLRIEEIHHNKKKDAPSGTAKALREKLQSFGTHTIPEPSSLRAGGVLGVHKVLAVSQDEMIVLEHQALNRQVFARGALLAADWILGQAPGLYSMDDLYR